MKKHNVRPFGNLRPFGGLFTASLLVTGIVAAPGCGGGGTRSSPVSAPSAPASQGLGRATFTVTWPAPSSSRLIPSAANSIVVKITTIDGAALAEQRLTRPAGGGTTTATFAELPAGDVIASVSAYPNADGTGIAQASASASVAIEGGKTAALSLTLDSTIDRLEVTAPAGSLVNGAPVTLIGFPLPLSAVAKNSADEIVLTDIHSRGSARAIAGATLAILKGVGHSPHWSAPQASLDAILDVAQRAQRSALMAR
ncbi:MAG: hypothetical protein V4671_01155 [Armatimonadota bacterium]